MAAAEGVQEPCDVGMPPQREAGQLQARRPAFGAGSERRDGRIVQAEPRGCGEQRGRLICGKAKLIRAQLGELPPGPQPRQGQRRIGPAGHNQAQPRRQMLEQEPERRVYRL